MLLTFRKLYFDNTEPTHLIIVFNNLVLPSFRIPAPYTYIQTFKIKQRLISPLEIFSEYSSSCPSLSS